MQTPSVHQQMLESTIDLAGQIVDKYNIPEYVKVIDITLQQSFE